MGISAKTTNETVTDIDGNIYTTVKIGNQEWTVENLKTTKYNDKSPIPYVSEFYEEQYESKFLWFKPKIKSRMIEWKKVGEKGQEAYCWHDNDIKTKEIYGALYNWHAINTGKLAPKGWHVPTED